MTRGPIIVLPIVLTNKNDINTLLLLLLLLLLLSLLLEWLLEWLEWLSEWLLVAF